MHLYNHSTQAWPPEREELEWTVASSSYCCKQIASPPLANLITSCSVHGKSAQLVFGKYQSLFTAWSFCADFIHFLSLSKNLN